MMELYNALISAPRPERATFFGPSKSYIDIIYSNISISRSSFFSSRRVTKVSPVIEVDSYANVPTSLDPTVNFISHSPDGRWEVHFISVEDQGRFLEVWEHGIKWGEVSVGEEHGMWFFDGAVGFPTFSLDSSKMVYIANPHPSTVSDEDYFPSFGEKYRSLLIPHIIGLNLSDLSVVKILTSPVQVATDNAYMVDPSVISWDNDHIQLLTTGWRRLGDESQLGMAWCANRPSSIYMVDIHLDSGKILARNMSTSGESARSPRLTASREIFYLSNQEGGPHNSCAQLYKADPLAGTNDLLVDVVYSPQKCSFPGIFALDLPQQPFLKIDGNTYIAFNSDWGCRQTTILINAETGQVTDLASLIPQNQGWPTEASLELFCTDGLSKALVAISTPNVPRKLVLITLSDGLRVVKIQDIDVPGVVGKVADSLSKLDFIVKAIPSNDPMEMLLVSPCPLSELKDLKPPIIILPHGGPHGHDNTTFHPLRAAFALSGYLVVQPNYSGSTGYGKEFLDRLQPPALSVEEVETTIAVIPVLKHMGLDWRKGKRFFVGASHGGYISAWISSRYTNMIDAAVMMNPTINYPAMIHSTDIPDVITASSGVSYSYSSPPTTYTPDEYARHYACSPISVVEKARAPTLILLGADDGRVSPEQGRMWYHGLRKTGVDAALKIYKGERHGLDMTITGLQGVYKETCAWLEKYASWD